jgi:hypothetical protein
MIVLDYITAFHKKQAMKPSSQTVRNYRGQAAYEVLQTAQAVMPGRSAQHQEVVLGGRGVQPLITGWPTSARTHEQVNGQVRSNKIRSIYCTSIIRVGARSAILHLPPFHFPTSAKCQRTSGLYYVDPSLRLPMNMEVPLPLHVHPPALCNHRTLWSTSGPFSRSREIETRDRGDSIRVAMELVFNRSLVGCAS